MDPEVKFCDRQRKFASKISYSDGRYLHHLRLCIEFLKAFQNESDNQETPENILLIYSIQESMRDELRWTEVDGVKNYSEEDLNLIKYDYMIVKTLDVTK